MSEDRFYIKDLQPIREFCLNSDKEDVYKYIYLLQQENQKLKETLEKKENPLKGIFAQVNDDTLLRDCGNMNAEINELKTQQKEFIKYLEDNEIKIDIKANGMGASSVRDELIIKARAYREILSKYKEIIGMEDDTGDKEWK